jgi:AraC-like DNA-binding protein
MQQIANWYFSLVFFVTLLGFIVAGILFFANKSDSFSARLLGAFLIAISMVALNNELMATAFYLHYPHFWRLVVAASFCVPPLGYLYVRSVLEQSYRFRRRDFLFFLPAVLYTLTLLPFYILPADQKLEMITKIIANNRLIALEPEGILPTGWGVMFRVIYGLITNIAQFVLLANWKRKTLTVERKSFQNAAIFRWLFLFTLVMSSLYALLIVTIAFQLTLLFSIWNIVIFSITISILFICLYLLFQPSILYGLTGWLQQEPFSVLEVIPPMDNAAVLEEKRNTLSIEQGQAFKQAMEGHFHHNHPYRKPGYTIGNLSQELGIPSHQLSAFINQEYGKNFNELINDCRVDYLDEMLKTYPENYRFTLEALGKQVGFNSRPAFIAAVKKKTGLTPSAFFQKNR